MIPREWFYPDPPRKTLRRAIDRWMPDGMSADQLDQFRDLMNKAEAEARQQERERLAALVEGLVPPRSPRTYFEEGWLDHRAAVLALLREDPE